jgi:hypothetical protein
MSVHWFYCKKCNLEFTFILGDITRGDVAICPSCYGKKVIDLKNDKKHKQKEVNVQ